MLDTNGRQASRLIALLQLSTFCHVAVNVRRLVFTVPWDDLQSVIVAFPGHTHLPYFQIYTIVWLEVYGNRIVSPHLATRAIIEFYSHVLGKEQYVNLQ